jgi:hypothetical protein
MNAFRNVENTVHIDVAQTIFSSLMKLEASRNNIPASMSWLKRGIEKGQNKLNTDLSRINFLEAAVNVCIQFKNTDRANALLKELYNLQDAVNEKQQNQRVFVLQEYFKKNQNIDLPYPYIVSFSCLPEKGTPLPFYIQWVKSKRKPYQ